MISRKEAQELDLQWFQTGVACKNGHTGDRSVRTGACRECRNAAVRTHRERNPELSKERLYAWRRANPEKVSRIQRDYRARHSIKSTESVRKWRHSNPELARKASKKQYRSDPEYYIQYSRRRRETLCQRVWDHEREAIKEVYRKCPPGQTVDHHIPLKHPLVCGLHCVANLNYLSREANSRKHNKFSSEEHS